MIFTYCCTSVAQEVQYSAVIIIPAKPLDVGQDSFDKICLALFSC